MKKQYTIGAQYRNYTIRRYIRTNFPHLSQNRIHKSIREGDIRINGAKTHIDAILMTNDKVSIWDVLLHDDESYMENHMSQPHEYAFLLDTLVDKRNDLWCFNKPHGLAMQGGTNLKTNMCQLLTGWMNQYDYVNVSPVAENNLDISNENGSIHSDNVKTSSKSASSSHASKNTPEQQSIHTTASSGKAQTSARKSDTYANHRNVSESANHSQKNSAAQHASYSDNEIVDSKCKPYIVHRLDRNTSGCCLIATNSIAANTLARAFENHLIKKHYVAICEVFADIPNKGRIEFDIDGQYACTDYVVEQILCKDIANDPEYQYVIGAEQSTQLSYNHSRHNAYNEHMSTDSSYGSAYNNMQKKSESGYDRQSESFRSSATYDNSYNNQQYGDDYDLSDSRRSSDNQQYEAGYDAGAQSSDSYEPQQDRARERSSRSRTTSVSAPIKLAVIAFYPTTGRKHQIRKHIAGIGCPILGDDLYNPGTRYKYMCLHAKSISFAGNAQMSSFHYTASLPAYMQKLLNLRRF